MMSRRLQLDHSNITAQSSRKKKNVVFRLTGYFQITNDLRMVKNIMYCTLLMLAGISGLPDIGVCLFQELGVITSLPSS